MTSVLSKPQKALVSTIETGHVIIEECAESLETKAELPELGTDPASIKWKQVTLDSNKQTVTSQIAAMNAATAEVVTLTSCKLPVLYFVYSGQEFLHLLSRKYLFAREFLFCFVFFIHFHFFIKVKPVAFMLKFI